MTVTLALQRSAEKKLRNKGILRTKPEILFRSTTGATSRADFRLKFESAGKKKGAADDRARQEARPAGSSWRWRRSPASGAASELADAQAREFEIPTFVAPGVSKDQSPSTAAGARPFELVNNFAVNQNTTPEPIFNDGHAGPAANVKDATFEMPPGIVANAAAYPRCTQDAVPLASTARSQHRSERATIRLTAGQANYPYPVFNMVPPPGVPAQFAFKVIASNVHINFHVRSGTDYGVTVDPARPQRGGRAARTRR